MEDQRRRSGANLGRIIFSCGGGGDCQISGESQEEAAEEEEFGVGEKFSPLSSLFEQ